MIIIFIIVVVDASTRKLIVLDDVYPNPDVVRAAALAMEFNVTGNFPGFRTRTPFSLSPAVEAKLYEALGNVHIYPATDYHGAFQYALKTHRSWIHTDRTAWSGVLYLSPNPAPRSGTRFFAHKATGLTERPNEEDAARLGYKDNVSGLTQALYRDAQHYDRWQLLDEVGNRYNRLVLFRGYSWHQSARYFGEDLQSARLFQTFFFDTR